MTEHNYSLGEITFYDDESVKRIIRRMIDADGSDLHITAKRKPIMEIGQEYTPLADRALDIDESFYIANYLYGSDTARTMVERGQHIDNNFVFKYKKDGDFLSKEYRFRLNVMPITVRGNNVPSITVRQLPPDPPKWTDMGYGEELWSIFRPPSGLVFVSGPTGSGKSTLLASGIRRIAEDLENEKIITFEDPIEFVYDSFINDKVIIEQSAVGVNCVDFFSGMKPFLRRRPTIAVVGEARDQETIRTCLYAAQTGHLVYTTGHTNGAPESVKRLLNEFPVNEHESRLHDIIEVASVFVSQRLFRKTTGGVIALREVLHFNHEVKSYLEGINISNYVEKLRKATELYGESMVLQGRKLFEEGVISEETLNKIIIDFDRSDYDT